MKRKWLAGLLALCMLFVMAPITALAADAATVSGEQSLKNAAANGGEITLGANITLSSTLEIASGKNVTLNLGGHTLSANENVDVISNKGTLTVNGDGTVKSAGTGGALVNYPDAQATLSGGTYTGAKWYTIKNMGTMSISGSTVTTTNTGESSLVVNGYYGGKSENDRGQVAKEGSALTISSGTFTGGMNAVKNDDYGVVTITGGSFTNNNGPAVLNWHKANISDGEFDSTSSHVLANAMLAGGADAGELTITGGTFKSPADTLLFGYSPTAQNGGKVSISGAKFQGVVDNGSLTYTVEITSGEFTSQVPAGYIVSGQTAASLTASGSTAYYVGAANDVAAKLADAEEGATITIQQGDLTLSNMASGVKVKNSGNGSVAVNGTSVRKDESLTVPAPHSHNGVKTEATDATCTEAGNTAYWYCAGCGKYFSDASCQTEIEPANTVIAAKGHSAVKAEEKKATAAKDGNIAYWYCAECGKYFRDEALTQEISKQDTVIPATGAAGGNTADEPSESEKPTQKPAQEGSNPQTGDNSPLFLWTVLLLASGAAIAVLLVIKRKLCR